MVGWFCFGDVVGNRLVVCVGCMVEPMEELSCSWVRIGKNVKLTYLQVRRS